MKNLRPLGAALLLLALTACGAGRQESAQTPDPAAADDRGIPGLLAAPLAEALSGEPYYMPPSPRMAPVGKQAEQAAFLYESHGKDDTGLTFDYELLSDANDELVTATLSVSAKRMSDTKLYQTALRLCEQVADLPYDTAGGEELLTWMQEGLATYSAVVDTMTVGDAQFTFSSMPELNCTIEIQRVEP